jgi:mxaJ protein
MIRSVSLLGRALSASAALVLLSLSHAQAAQPLRVCADPSYMPYSDSAGQGFENKIAEAVGRDLGRPVQYYWAPVRSFDEFSEYIQRTLKANRCDLLIDVPYGMINVSTTAPYYISSYVFVYKKSKGYNISSLDSPELRHLKIGYEADTPAEEGLKLRGLTPGQKPFMTADEPSQQPSAIVDAVENGTIDVGITWDPAIAYYAAQHPDLGTTIVPNSRSQGSPEQYSFPMAMATRPNDKELNSALDRVIATHRNQFAAILRDYHIRFFLPGD